MVNGYFTQTAGTPFLMRDGVFIGNLSGGNPFLYAPDKSRPAINDFNQWQTTNRGTWQVIGAPQDRVCPTTGNTAVTATAASRRP